MLYVAHPDHPRTREPEPLGGRDPAPLSRHRGSRQWHCALPSPTACSTSSRARPSAPWGETGRPAGGSASAPCPATLD